MLSNGECLSLGCMGHQSPLFIFYLLSQCLYQPCFFLCVVVLEHIIAIITSIFSTQKNGNTGIWMKNLLYKGSLQFSLHRGPLVSPVATSTTEDLGVIHLGYSWKSKMEFVIFEFRSRWIFGVRTFFLHGRRVWIFNWGDITLKEMKIGSLGLNVWDITMLGGPLKLNPIQQNLIP